MNNLRTAFICIAFMLINIFPATNLFAQKCPMPDVAGLVCGNVYKYADVTAKLGQPSSYRSIEGEEGLDEEYYYRTNLLRFQGNGVFTDFVLENTQFAIYTAYLNGGIKVGNPVTKFQQLGFGSLKLKQDGEYMFILQDSWIEIRHNKGIITKLFFSIPD